MIAKMNYVTSVVSYTETITIAMLQSSFVRTEEHPMWDMKMDRVKYVLFDVPRDTFYFRDAFHTRHFDMT